jgi:glycosyltransferase involved in cell wall biosynthesis
VPCGVDPEYFKKAPGGNAGLLYVGSWISKKGVATIARAYGQLQRWGHNIPFSVVGYGVPKQVVLSEFDASLRGLLRVDEQLRVLDQDELIEEYHKHTILVFPSVYEGFGLVFLEAMASGLAVIATPVGGAVDVIKDGHNGLIVSEGDPVALATAIASLWVSPERRSKIGAAARETARSYTWPGMAKRTIQCYEAAIGGDALDPVPGVRQPRIDV